MRLPLSVVLAGLALASTSAAQTGADTLTGSRGLIEERAHDVVLTLSRGHATLVVERTVENLGKRHDQADWLIELPDTAVATRLRTRGFVDGKPRWFLGELMEAEAAAAKYRELTGIGGYYPKDPALLSWRHQGQLALQVFPIPPAERKTVSYTLEMPTTYRDGRHELSLPPLGLEGRSARIVVRPERAGDRVLVGGQPFPAGAGLAWTEDQPAALALAPARAPALDAALGVQPFGERRVLVHYRVEAGPRVAQVPRDAQIVVILDASRSLTPEAAEAVRDAAVAYLGHFDDARVEVLTVDRRVHRQHGRLVPVSVARAALTSRAPALANGSNVDAALARADEILAAAPAGHARRVLLLGDLLTRDGLHVEKLAGALRRSGALLHVGRVTAGATELEVEEDSPWSGVARTTGGLLWHASIEDATQARAKLEEWARPVRVHHLRVIAPGVTLEPVDGADALADGTLDEGQGIAGLQIASDAPPWLEIKGELWAHAVRVRVERDAAESRLWSALTFGNDLLGQLSEPEMMVLARHGRAVSPVTSYLAVEPGVRPSTEGFEEDAGVGSLSGIGVGSGSSIACAAMTPRAPFDRSAWLREALAGAARACGYGANGVTIELETTRAEIVDVHRVRSAGSTGDRRCLEEATWGIELPSAFTDEHADYEIAVEG
jgi:hypothetical protein